MLILKIKMNIIATSVPAVAMVSSRASVAVAFIESESIAFAHLLKNMNWLNFMQTLMLKMRITTQVTDVVEGFRILLKEDMHETTPRTQIMSATRNAEMYSYLACPKGCSSSAGLLESLKPNNVTNDEMPSERLFMASDMIATEPLINPTISLLTNKIKFVIIPYKLVAMPYFKRLFEFFVLE